MENLISCVQHTGDFNLHIDICLQFYFKNGYPPSKELKEECLSRINHRFNNPLGGLQIDGEKII